MAARPTGVPMDTGSNPWEVKDLFPGPRASVTKFMEIKSSAHGNWVEQRGTRLHDRATTITSQSEKG